MRVLICDICQAAMKDTEHPFAFGTGTDHPKFAKRPESSWSVGEDARAPAHPFMARPFKFMQHWELCSACGVKLMEVLAKAAISGRKEMEEFKKLIS